MGRRSAVVIRYNVAPTQILPKYVSYFPSPALFGPTPTCGNDVRARNSALIFTDTESKSTNRWEFA